MGNLNEQAHHFSARMPTMPNQDERLPPYDARPITVGLLEGQTVYYQGVPITAVSIGRGQCRLRFEVSGEFVFDQNRLAITKRVG